VPIPLQKLMVKGTTTRADLVLQHLCPRMHHSHVFIHLCTQVPSRTTVPPCDRLASRRAPR
jgi:hypothetical protein